MNNQSRKNESASACPNTLCGVVCCLIVCAAIVFIVHLVVSQQSAQSRRLWITAVVATNGNQATIMAETRQMEFWTPSAKTKDYLSKEGGKIAGNDKWEVIPSDAAVLQFGAILHSNVNVLGYRRVEVWGQGRTNFKPGWWWTMNVYTNYSVVELAHTYQAFWKAPQPVFVEVIDNRGSDE